MTPRPDRGGPDPYAARLLARRTELLGRLAELELGFGVPRPLTQVREVDGLAAVAVSWIGGAPQPSGTGDPTRLRAVLDALAGIDLGALADVLDVPHAYAGREDWEHLMRTAVVDRLPDALADEVVRRVDAAVSLPPVPPVLVHGDLAGHNMHWDDTGRLVGVLDWDLACAFDPAVDVACLAWHGWDTVAAAVDAETLGRARTWFDTFALEQVASAIAHGEPEDVIAGHARAAARSLGR